ncbi:MAG: alpha/beta fold hydrolase, partial [Nocardioidaceae bacterium]
FVRHDARSQGEPVLFVHGNVSDSVFWEETLLALPAGLRGLAADLRGFGGTEPLAIDATRGLRDFSDDLATMLDALGIDRVHLVGWSMGGGVVMRLLIDHPARVASLTLVNPVSPYGFGGTRADGSLLAPDGAGSGGGTANPEFVARIEAHDSAGTDAASPRGVMNALYFAAVPDGVRDAAFVESMLSTRIGTDFYPGDQVPSQTWPGTAPGGSGVLNTMAPTYCDLTGLVDVHPQPPVLWVHGSADQIVSDTSMFDLAVLGRLGAIPGWPGEDVVPPQPMVSQTRDVLDRYRYAGGRVEEVVVEGAGHSPHIEKPEEFRATLFGFLSAPPKPPSG